MIKIGASTLLRRGQQIRFTSMLNGGSSNTPIEFDCGMNSIGNSFEAIHRGTRALCTAEKPLSAAEVPNGVKMEKSVNKVTLMGRVGGNPQKRGNVEHPVVVFTLATHTNYTYNSGSVLQKTDWHRVCVFKPNLRETVYKYLAKGQRVYVEGRISYGEVKDEHGNAQTATSIIADDIIFFPLATQLTKDATMDTS